MPSPPRGAASSESASIAPAPLPFAMMCGVAMVWCDVVAATAGGSVLRGV